MCVVRGNSIYQGWKAACQFQSRPYLKVYSGPMLHRGSPRQQPRLAKGLHAAEIAVKHCGLQTGFSNILPYGSGHRDLSRPAERVLNAHICRCVDMAIDCFPSSLLLMCLHVPHSRRGSISGCADSAPPCQCRDKVARIVVDERQNSVFLEVCS